MEKETSEQIIQRMKKMSNADLQRDELAGLTKHVPKLMEGSNAHAGDGHERNADVPDFY